MASVSVQVRKIELVPEMLDALKAAQAEEHSTDYVAPGTLREDLRPELTLGGFEFWSWLTYLVEVKYTRFCYTDEDGAQIPGEKKETAVDAVRGLRFGLYSCGPMGANGKTAGALIVHGGHVKQVIYLLDALANQVYREQAPSRDFSPGDYYRIDLFEIDFAQVLAEFVQSNRLLTVNNLTVAELEAVLNLGVIKSAKIDAHDYDKVNDFLRRNPHGKYTRGLSVQLQYPETAKITYSAKGTVAASCKDQHGDAWKLLLEAIDVLLGHEIEPMPTLFDDEEEQGGDRVLRAAQDAAKELKDTLKKSGVTITSVTEVARG